MRRRPTASASLRRGGSEPRLPPHLLRGLRDDEVVMNDASEDLLALLMLKTKNDGEDSATSRARYPTTSSSSSTTQVT